MMKKNGFVFMETVVVVCVLSVTLLMLYGSYSHILRVSRQKKTFDTTDSIYTTFFTKQLIDKHKGSNSYKGYFGSNCYSIENNYTYMCNITEEANKNNPKWAQLNFAFDVDKIYYLTPSRILTQDNILIQLDATTIDYVRSLGKGVTSPIIIVKYKHYHADGTYEVIHSSIEVD